MEIGPPFGFTTKHISNKIQNVQKCLKMDLKRSEGLKMIKGKKRLFKCITIAQNPSKDSNGSK